MSVSVWNDLSWVESIRSPFLNIFFDTISLAGYPTFLILFISFGYFYWSPARFSRIAMMLFISALINTFLKDFFQDPRPAIELMLDPKVGTSYGWPSGHSQIAVTLWGLLAYELKNKWITVGAISTILLIAFSRMYLGVHDFGDVFAGLLIGGIILSVWHYAVINNWYEKLTKRHWLILIILFQLILYIFYPSHEGHELSIWFLGVMTGWFLGLSNISLISNSFKRFFLSISATAIIFISLIYITQLEAGIQYKGVLGIIYSYLLGMMFAILVTWLIPRLLRSMRLAS
ncbi:MAG: phosphatase PAP2 family protein [Gammaproteobacteria bacterium]